jgi:four helix bundle protein
LNEKIGSLIDQGIFKQNYRLIGQLEGSAGSMMDNISEGFKRSGNKGFIQFLYISKGSSGEFRSQLYRALDRSYITKEQFQNLYDSATEIAVLMQKLIDYLHNSEIKGIKYKKNDRAENNQTFQTFQTFKQSNIQTKQI